MNPLLYSDKYGLIEMPDYYKALGFLNRHENPLPDYKCAIKIIHIDVDGPSTLLCSWDPNSIQGKIIGTARVIYGQYTGIGFHVHKTNNEEFIWYQIVDLSPVDVKHF